MKFSFAHNTCFGIGLGLVCSISSAQAQLAGQTTGTGTGFGAPTGATSNKLPGSFGGPGVTGQSRLELSGTNPSTAFSNGQSVSGTSSSGTTGTSGGLAGQTTSGTQFGANAFSSSTQTGGANALGGLNGGLGGLGMNRFGGGLGGLGGLGGGTGNTNAAAKKMIRPIIRPDVEVTRESNSEIATNAKKRLGRIQMPKRLKGVEATVDGETVVLSGQVATESDKRMVERLVMLEPGIDSVRNEVTVKTSPVEGIQAKPNR